MILKEKLSEATVAMQNGSYAKALSCLVWIYDNPIENDLSSEMFRRVGAFIALARLANIYPPAKTAIDDLILSNINELKVRPESVRIKADLGALQAAQRDASLSENE